jgi:hypothetical protein
MASEKERFEILLEDIRDSVKLIAEGHQSLRNELERGFSEVREEIRNLASEFHLYARTTSERIGKLERSF